MHHPLVLLALVPLGAVMWWALVSWRQLNALADENKRLSADLERRYPWLRSQDEP